MSRLRGCPHLSYDRAMELGSRKCSTCGAAVLGTDSALVKCKYCGAVLVVDEDPGLLRGLTRATRSQDTRLPVPITFVNAKGVALDLFWLDFAGAEKSYGRIEAGQQRAFDTFVGHVWSIRAAGSAVEVVRWAAPDQAPRHITIR